MMARWKIQMGIRFISIIFLFTTNFSFCQDSLKIDLSKQNKHSHKYIRRNIIWFNPSRANEINGISLSAIISTHLFHADSLKIRGLNIGIEPEWIMGIPYIRPLA